MEKEDILKASRQEHKDGDLVELELVRRAWYYAGIVGALTCCLLVVLVGAITHTAPYSPWAIYFSMIATNWTVRAIKLKKKSDWIVAATAALLAILALVGVIFRMIEVAA